MVGQQAIVLTSKLCYSEAVRNLDTFKCMLGKEEGAQTTVSPSRSLRRGYIVVAGKGSSPLSLMFG